MSTVEAFPLLVRAKDVASEDALCKCLAVLCDSVKVLNVRIAAGQLTGNEAAIGQAVCAAISSLSAELGKKSNSAKPVVLQDEAVDRLISEVAAEHGIDHLFKSASATQPTAASALRRDSQ